MDDTTLIATWAFAFRIAERIVISLVVILVSLVVTVGFWRSIQRIDFQLSREKVSGAANVILATPVFALLALIGFAWVSFSNPISVGLPAAGGEADQVAGDPPGVITLSGSVPAPAAPGDDMALSRNLATVRSLNCIAGITGEGLSPRDADALRDARLALMQAVWQPDWGDPADFAAWATGRTTDAPDPEARAQFDQAHLAC